MTDSNKPSTQNCLFCVDIKRTRTNSAKKFIFHLKAAAINENIYGIMEETASAGNLYFLEMTGTEHRYMRVKLLKIMRSSKVITIVPMLDWTTKNEGAHVHIDNAAEILSIC